MDQFGPIYRTKNIIRRNFTNLYFNQYRTIVFYHIIKKKLGNIDIFSSITYFLFLQT
jgi:hypothetical protein